MKCAENTKSSEIWGRWMTLKQAAKYSPFGEKLLIELIKSGKVKGGRLVDKGTRDYFIDKNSMDKYMESQCIDAEFKNKILENFKRLI